MSAHDQNHAITPSLNAHLLTISVSAKRKWYSISAWVHTSDEGHHNYSITSFVNTQSPSQQTRHHLNEINPGLILLDSCTSPSYPSRWSWKPAGCRISWDVECGHADKRRPLCLVWLTTELSHISRLQEAETQKLPAFQGDLDKKAGIPREWL